MKLQEALAQSTHAYNNHPTSSPEGAVNAHATLNPDGSVTVRSYLLEGEYDTITGTLAEVERIYYMSGVDDSGIDEDGNGELIDIGGWSPGRETWTITP
jgi:hypothetical protein